MKKGPQGRAWAGAMHSRPPAREGPFGHLVHLALGTSRSNNTQGRAHLASGGLPGVSCGQQTAPPPGVVDGGVLQGGAPFAPIPAQRPTHHSPPVEVLLSQARSSLENELMVAEVAEQGVGTGWEEGRDS